MRSPWCALGLLVAVFFARDLRAQGSDLIVAKQMFDAERWPEAALALHGVMASNAPQADKELARYELGVALYQLGFKQASYGLFSEIADKPTGAQFSEALPWLTQLSIDLPEAADVIERVGKYDDSHAAAFHNPAQSQIYWRIAYLRGRYAMRNMQLDQAVERFALVGRASPLYGKAQIFTGLAHVQLRHAVPAVQAFQRLLRWLDQDLPDTVTEPQRLRDLANLSIARIHYSAAVRSDPTNVVTLDAQQLSAAVKYDRRVDPTGDYFYDSVFEEAWARFLAADYTRALGNLRIVTAPEAGPRYPEAMILEAASLHALCRYDEASAVIAKMKQTYEPRRAELASALAALGAAGDGGFELVRKASGVAADVLSDRLLEDRLAYVTFLAEERKRLSEMPAAFRDTPLGGDVADSITLGLDIAKRNAVDLAKARLLRANDELVSHLRDAQKMLVDITAAQRHEGPPGDATVAESGITVKPAFLSWPLNGSVPADGQSFFRVPITARCGR
jgi:hypothetical protein